MSGALRTLRPQLSPRGDLRPEMGLGRRQVSNFRRETLRTEDQGGHRGRQAEAGQGPLLDRGRGLTSAWRVSLPLVATCNNIARS